MWEHLHEQLCCLQCNVPSCLSPASCCQELTASFVNTIYHSKVSKYSACQAHNTAKTNTFACLSTYFVLSQELALHVRNIKEQHTNRHKIPNHIKHKSNENDAYSGRHSSPLCSQEVMLFRLMRGPEGIETESTWEGGRAWEQERHVPFQKLCLLMNLL